MRPFAALVLDDRRRWLRVELARAIDSARLCREEVARTEPWAPWRRDFLALRVRCYEETADPRVHQARRDLARFVRHEPPVFSLGLLPAPGQ